MTGQTTDKDSDNSPSTAKRGEQGKPDKDNKGKAGRAGQQAVTLDEQGDPGKGGGPKTGFAAVVPKR